MLDTRRQPRLVSDVSTWMHPVAVGKCFGWLHMPPGQVTANTAVLLCPGFRDDALTAHSHFRQLATALASAGYSTLRFDYPGTGNSCDPDLRDDLWAVWTDSAGEAADWLRRVTAAERLVFCGLRLGATLAAEVARRRDDVAALMLLAPLARGRTFVRQLEVEAKLAGKVQSDGLMMNGAPLSTKSQQSLGSLDLQRLRPPGGCRSAIFDSKPTPVMTRCALTWAEAGAVVEQIQFAGLDTMLRSRVMSHEKPADFAPVIEWLERKVPAQPGRYRALPPSALLMRDGCQETALRFGPANGLFGMLCRPTGQDCERVVLILNSGGDPGYGQDRSALDMARRLAAAGIASLRMDFAGLGDSVTPGETQTHIFATDRTPDVAAALDALQAAGFAHFAVHGLCSGAYHGFQAAVADNRIDCLLLINLPVLHWDPNTAIESFALTQTSLSVKASKLRMPLTWVRLFRGQLRVRSRALALAGDVLGKLKQHAGRHGGPKPSSVPHPVWRAMPSQTRILLLMSQFEVGLAALRKEFGPSRVAPGMTLHVLPELDHSMTTAPMRELATDMMIDFLIAKPTQRRREGRVAVQKLGAERRMTGTSRR